MNSRERWASLLYGITDWAIFAPDDEDEAARRYVSQLWAEDWDCPEDGGYDE